MQQFLNKVSLISFEKGIELLPEKSIDLVITDPPYQFTKVSKSGCFFTEGSPEYRKYAQELADLGCDNFAPQPFLESLKKVLKEYYGYFFCNKNLVYDYVDFAKKNGYFYDILIMAKTNPIPKKNNHHLPDLEYIVLIRDKATKFNLDCNIADYRKLYITNSNRPKGTHPAQKDVKLIERFVRISSMRNDIILDPFAGSGSSLVAAKKNGRQYMGFDTSEKWANHSNERLSYHKEQGVQKTII